MVKVCRQCGCRLARDHQEDELCSPCERSLVREYDPPRREDDFPEIRFDYDPRRDPFFHDALLACLSERPGETVEPLKALGLEHCYRRYVHSGVRALRKRGFDIRGSARVCGFKYMGFVETGHFFPPCDSEDVESP